MSVKRFTGNAAILALFMTLLFCSEKLAAQGTWSQVHAILQTNCSGSSCHSAASANPLKLIGTEADIYGNLVNVAPTNPDAAGGGYKLIDPGHPHLSFLLKKVNNGLDPDNDLDDIAQGSPMPLSAPSLTNAEIDLIASWILHGAPQTGSIADQQLIADYHSLGGLSHGDPIAAPAPGDGFQIHYGAIFIGPNDEKEYFLKRKLPIITEDMEITRLETYIDLESHHYIIYKFDNQGAADAQAEGLREVTGISDAFVNGTSMVAAWQNSANIELPEGTAYFWTTNDMLDLNLHVRNYSPDSILKAEVYTNVYLKPRQTNTIEMRSELVLFSTLPLSILPCTFNNFCIPNDGQDHTFTGSITDADLPTGGADSLYVWLLASHTHKFGKAFDIYMRNPGGGKGQKVYDGNYNFDYSFYQGYYDYEDPAVRYFDMDTFAVKASDGFIQEATFNNDSAVDVGFGLTTKDEMMLTFLQYTTERPVTAGIGSQGMESVIAVHPNPVGEGMPVTFTRNRPERNGSVTLYDLVGKKVLEQQFPAGSYKLQLNKSQLRPGVYLYAIRSSESNATSGKLILY